MCGLAGYIGSQPPDADVRARVLRAMAHRGPDGSGQRVIALSDSTVVLLHTRLAIIDPDPRSAQPFEADGCVLVFNGEIYNYLEIRDELIALGHSFRTHSDTEVLLQAYLAWGEAALDRLEGMWAFALLDPRDGGRLLLSRDRFGEKPLHLHRCSHGLYFASEIKQLAALTGKHFTVNAEKVHRFLAHGYRALFRDQTCFFQDVTAFPAGQAAWISQSGAGEPKPYWTPTFSPVAMTAGEAAEGAAAEIDRAIRIRLRSDV
ncbi:MAG: asparagine synthetase B, partial [Rhodospirillaceae bacterium]|nr:asparagine synthetase B [Rhodospirillaceae bacterium]